MKVTYHPSGSDKPREETFSLESDSRLQASTETTATVESTFAVTLRGSKKPIVVKATSFSSVGKWTDFISVVDGTEVQVLSVPSAGIGQIRRVE